MADKLMEYLSSIHDNIRTLSKDCLGKIEEKTEEWNKVLEYTSTIFNEIQLEDYKFRINALKTLEVSMRLNGMSDKKWSPVAHIYEEVLNEYKKLKKNNEI